MEKKIKIKNRHVISHVDSTASVHHFFTWVFVVILLWGITWKKNVTKYKVPYHIPYTFPDTNPVVSETIQLKDLEITDVYSKSLDYFKSIEEFNAYPYQKIFIKVKKSVQDSVIEIRFIKFGNIIQGLKRGVTGYIRLSFLRENTNEYLEIYVVPDAPLEEDIYLNLWRKVVHDYLKYMNLELTYDGYSSVYTKQDEEVIEKYKWTHY